MKKEAIRNGNGNAARRAFSDAYLLYFVFRNNNYLKNFVSTTVTLKDLRNAIFKNIDEDAVNEYLKDFHTDIRNLAKIEFYTVADMKKNIDKEWKPYKEEL